MFPAGGTIIAVSDLDPLFLQNLENPDVRRAEHFLESIIVPRVEFSNASLIDALDEIQNDAAEYSVTRQSFALTIDLGAGQEKAKHSTGRDPFARTSEEVSTDDSGNFGFDANPSVSSPAFLYEGSFTGTYTNVTIKTLLNEVTRHFSVWYRVDPHSVVVLPESRQKPDYIFAKFPVDREFFRAEERSDPDPFASDRAAVEVGDALSAVAALERYGIVFEGEANAFYEERNSLLIVKADRSDIEFIATTLERLASKEGTP